MTDVRDQRLHNSTDPMHVSPFPSFATLHDAITDSPVYRANVVHWDEQLDLLDKWLQSLSMQLKQYTEKLNRFAADTFVTYEKLSAPAKMDEALIAPDFMSAAVQRFADTLQATLALQLKVTTDTDTYFVQPMHQFVRTHIKKYKEFRKQHDKALERYENQLQKYSTYCKTKNPSVWREEAFRLFDARKTYVLMSSEHVVDMIRFRSDIVNLLADQSSCVTLMQEDCEEGAQVWRSLKQSLGGWIQWLTEDRHTCAYEFQQFQQTRRRLEEEYINMIRPQRDISFYAPTAISIPSGSEKQDALGPKWGYLFLRMSRSSWVRKWCFLHGGYFGWCSLSKSGQRTVVVLDDRLPVALYNIRQAPEYDRGFCFEITAKHRQDTYVLQAETRQDMGDWLARFEMAGRSTSTQSSKHSTTHANLDKTLVDGMQAPSLAEGDSNDNSVSGTSARLISKSKSTTMVTTPRDVPATLSSAPGSSLSVHPSTSDICGLSTSSSSQNNVATPASPPKTSVPAIVTYASPTGIQNNPTLQTSLTLSPVLVWEASNLTHVIYEKLPSSYWGIPLPLLTSMLLNSRDPSLETLRAVIKSTEVEQILWPPFGDIRDAPALDIPGYTKELDTENRILHQLFGGVSESEMVLDVFMASLKRQPNAARPRELERARVLDDVFNGDAEMLPPPPPPSTHGYGYTGKAFVTQDALWFYSAVLMTSINTVAVKLKDIKDAYLAQDTSQVFGNESTVLVIELSVDDRNVTIRGPIIMAIPTEDPQAIVDKLRLLVENAKSNEPMQLQQLFSKIQSMSQKQTYMSLSSSVHAKDSPLSSLSTPPVKKKAKRLSFRGLGQARPTVVPTKQAYSSTGQLPLEGYASAKQNGRDLVRQPSFSDPNLARNVNNDVARRASVAEATPKQPAVTRVDIKPPADPDDLPSHIPLPAGPLSCECDDHLDKLDVEIEVPISAKRLYELMFSDEKSGPAASDGIWQGKTEGVLGHDLRVSTWEDAGEQRQRILKYIMPVTNPIVRMKEAEVVETQVLLKEQEHLVYVVQISTKTAALPYADAFIPSVRYCITYVDKSRCKLACYVGVKWVKSVIVRAIVTRAAIKGMSDSVAVFIPLIKDAADKLAAEVESERRERLAEYERAKSANVSEPDGVVKPTGEPSGAAPSHNENLPVQKNLSPPVSTKDNRLDIASVSKKNPVTSEHRHRALSEPVQRKVITAGIHLDSLPTNSIANGLVLNSKASQAKNTVTTPMPSKEKQVQNNVPEPTVWPETVMRYVRRLPSKRILSIVALVFITYILWIAFRSRSILESSLHVDNTNHSGQPCHTQAKPLGTTSGTTQTRSQRAVYLRDLEEGIFRGQDFEPSYVNSQSFQNFLRVKSSNLPPEQIYPWFSSVHHERDSELDLSRDRIAVMRHDMLSIFKMLNRVDFQLRESEYMNWLLDSRIRCRHFATDGAQDSQNALYPPCKEVYNQLSTFFSPNSKTISHP